MKKIIASIFIAFISSESFSSAISDAVITDIMIDINHGEKAFIELDKELLSRSSAECHSSQRWEYVLDISTKLGEKIYSNLLTAYATQNKVKIEGTGDCLHTGIEELRRLELFN